MSAARALGWLGVLLTLTGCSAFHYVAPDRPLAQAAVPPMLPRPQVALVLGSGGPRGYAHIGVLQALGLNAAELDKAKASWPPLEAAGIMAAQKAAEAKAKAAAEKKAKEAADKGK